MFTVKYHNQGFMVSTGDGSPVYARDVDELHRAIDHYFCRERTTVEGCPLCRWVAEHMKRPAGARRERGGQPLSIAT